MTAEDDALLDRYEPLIGKNVQVTSPLGAGGSVTWAGLVIAIASRETGELNAGVYDLVLQPPLGRLRTIPLFWITDCVVVP